MSMGLFRALARCVLGSVVAGAVYPAASSEAASARPYSAEISPQPLGAALVEFAKQTGLQLIYVSELVQGRMSHALAPGLPPSRALAELLSGTGLRFMFLNPRTVKIFAAPASDHASTPPGARQAVQQPSGGHPREEVVITANKREEALRTAPISVQVLSPADIDVLGIKGISDIAAQIPGIEYDFSSQWGPGILTNVAIRGINSNVGTSTTGIYIDDVPIQARNANFGNPYPVTFDLARIEILRGPQGTLFGAGAEGGAIRFISQNPSLTSVTAVYRGELSQTDHGGVSFESGAAVGGPLLDGRLGGRVTAWYRAEGGYIDHVDPLTGATVEHNANRTASKALRLALAFAPAEALLITPSFAYQATQIYDTPVFYTDLSNPAAGLLQNGKLLRQPAKDGFSVGSLKLEQGLGSYRLSSVSSYFDRTGTSTLDTTNEAGVYYYGGFGNPLGPAFPTSYLQAVPTSLELHQSVLAEEVRLASTEDARVRWVGGLFYSSARQRDVRDTYAQTAPANPGLYLNDYTIDTLLSGFGNIDIVLPRRWRLNVGIRVDRTRSEFTAREGGFAIPDLPAFSHAITQESPLTPRFGIVYQLSPQDILYANIAKGYRLGGINVAIPPECGAPTVPKSYATDSLWSREIGAKLALFDDRLRLEASVFDIDWSQIQEPVVFNCGFGYVANAGAATSTGFELAGHAALSRYFGVDLTVAMVSVHYTSTTLNSAGEVIEDRGTVVGGVPSVPAPWSATLGAHYQRQIAANVAAYVRAEQIVHSHNPGPFTENDSRSIGYDPRFHADPAWSQVNFQFGLICGKLDLRLFLNNALNAHPTLQSSADAPGSTPIYAYTLRPRTFGLVGNWSL